MLEPSSFWYWFIVTLVPFSAVLVLSHMFGVVIWKNRGLGLSYGRPFRWWALWVIAASVFLISTIPLLIMASFIGVFFVLAVISVFLGFATLVSSWLVVNSFVVEALSDAMGKTILDWVEAQAMEIDDWLWGKFSQRETYRRCLFDSLKIPGIAAGFLWKEGLVRYRAMKKTSMKQ